MAEDQDDQWDAFGSGDEPDRPSSGDDGSQQIGRPAAEPDAEPDAEPAGDDDGESIFSHPAAPWFVVALAVVLVVVFISMGRSDESGDRDRGGSGSAAGVDEDAGGDGGGGAAEEAAAPACPHYEMGANLFSEPEIADEPGVHIWHDMDGFHLRLVPIPGELESIAGTVVGHGVPLSTVEPLPAGVTDEGGTLTFELNAMQPQMDFKRSCDTTAIDFDITSGGAPVAAEHVTVGREARPSTMPFTLNQAS